MINVQEIIQDGVVDAQEANQIKAEILADGVIDREEADMLFEINDAVSGNDNSTEWNQLFVDAVAHHVLNDEETPGVVDADEAEWLLSKINGDGQVDTLERALLVYIGAVATKIESRELSDLIAEQLA